MPKEIERKFVLATEAKLGDLGLGSKIFQGYLLAQDGKEVRLRQNCRTSPSHPHGRFFLTSKEGSGLVRQEHEVEVSELIFQTLWPQTEGSRLIKWRYPAVDDPELVVDVYEGELAGLVVLEREFPSVDEAEIYNLPAWAKEAKEVTGDKRYSNAKLAS